MLHNTKKGEQVFFRSARLYGAILVGYLTHDFVPGRRAEVSVKMGMYPELEEIWVTKSQRHKSSYELYVLPNDITKPSAKERQKTLHVVDLLVKM